MACARRGIVRASGVSLIVKGGPLRGGHENPRPAA
jgi:hypothetical protein